MSVDECCSSMLNQTPSSSAAAAATAAVTRAKLSIDERDELMKNLQKLFKTHHKEQVGADEQQPGCSSAHTDSQIVAGTSRQSRLPSNLPLFVSHDSNYSTLKTTIVDGKPLGCFVIGGECRLCLPQLRALCLGQISTQQIDDAMAFLAIANALASDEQLIVLKRAGLAHPSLSKCELITKTNAERLISVLNSNGTAPMDEVQRSQLRSLRVVHECFGGCSALLFPALAPMPCFECSICLRMFGPEDFCRHTHQPTSDKNVCFWGFDVSNWAYYIRVDDNGGSGAVNDMDEAEQQFVNFVQAYPNTPPPV